MFTKELTHAGHRRRFSISSRGKAGWEVRDVQDEQVLKQICYTDWHRVERAQQMFNILIDELENDGWAAQPELTRN
jgi:hypothetical protein